MHLKQAHSLLHDTRIKTTIYNSHLLLYKLSYQERLQANNMTHDITTYVGTGEQAMQK